VLLSVHACGDGPEDGIGGNAVHGHQLTVPAMSHSSRRLDTRSLVPRDYVANPNDFGRASRPEWVLPAGGNIRSLRVAMVTHEVVFRVRALRDRRLAARVCARFGFSKQVWSRSLLGQEWMGELVLAAAVSEALGPRRAPADQRPGQPPRQTPGR
jgi:hypothetical protein